jgi:hypothetical protein
VNRQKIFGTQNGKIRNKKGRIKRKDKEQKRSMGSKGKRRDQKA